MLALENAEEVLQILDRYTKQKSKDIPPELDEYLAYVAKTGDTVYRWPTIQYLFREKLIHVIKEFHDTTVSIEDLPQCPNVDQFNYENMKSTLLERLELFHAAPFTIQRLCELLTDPKKHYSRLDKFMRALEKNILVVSTIEPGRKPVDADENGEDVIGADLMEINLEMDTIVKKHEPKTEKLTVLPPKETAEPATPGSSSVSNGNSEATAASKPVEAEKKSDTPAPVAEKTPATVEKTEPMVQDVEIKDAAAKEEVSKPAELPVEKVKESKVADEVVKGENGENGKNGEKGENGEEVVKAEKVEKVEKTEKIEKVDKSEKVEKIEKAENAEKIEKIEKDENSDKVEKIEKVADEAAKDIPVAAKSPTPDAAKPITEPSVAAAVKPEEKKEEIIKPAVDSEATNGTTTAAEKPTVVATKTDEAKSEKIEVPPAKSVEKEATEKTAALIATETATPSPAKSPKHVRGVDDDELVGSSAKKIKLVDGEAASVAVVAAVAVEKIEEPTKEAPPAEVAPVVETKSAAIATTPTEPAPAPSVEKPAVESPAVEEKKEDPIVEALEVAKSTDVPLAAVIAEQPIEDAIEAVAAIAGQLVEDVLPALITPTEVAKDQPIDIAVDAVAAPEVVGESMAVEETETAPAEETAMEAAPIKPDDEKMEVDESNSVDPMDL